MTSSVSTIPPRDPKMVEKIVDQLKSNGVFDQLRRDCLADVDTKPAYQNLRQRVEGYVSNFLSKQVWRPDLNKNQLRDQLRRQINQSGMLLTGVDRVIDQVVNPKIYNLFKPEIEKVVYAYLGIDKSKNSPQSMQTPMQSTSIISSGGIYPSYSVGQNIYPNYSVTSSSFNSYSTYNQSQSTPYSPYKQPPATSSQPQPYTQSAQNSFSYSLTNYNSSPVTSTSVANKLPHTSDIPEKLDIISVAGVEDVGQLTPGIVHQRKELENSENLVPVSKSNDVLDRKESIKSDSENISTDVNIVKKSLNDSDILGERELKEDPRLSRMDFKNDKGREVKSDNHRKNSFDLSKSRSFDNLSKSCESKDIRSKSFDNSSAKSSENKDVRSKSFDNSSAKICENKDIRPIKIKSSSLDRHHPESPKGKSGDFFKNKSPIKNDEKPKIIDDKIKNNDSKHKNKSSEEKRNKLGDEIRGKHIDSEESKNKIRTPEDIKFKNRSEESKQKSLHKEEMKLKQKISCSLKQKLKYHEEKLKNKSSDLEKSRHRGNEERNKLKLSIDIKNKEEKFKGDDKKSSIRPDKVKLFKHSKSNNLQKSNVCQELRTKHLSSDIKLGDSKMNLHNKSDGKLSFESQICYDNKTLLDCQYLLDKTKVIQMPSKKQKLDKLYIKSTKAITSFMTKSKLLSTDKVSHREDFLENKDKLKQNNKGNVAVLEIKHHDISELSDADSLAGWSDITVSSVHTSDLSSFDEEVTLTSSEDDDELTRLTEEKNKVPPATILDEIVKMDVQTELQVNDQHIEQKVKPKRLISLMGRYSDSDDEETKEEKRARMAAEKERRAERRAKLREKLEEKRKQTESIMAKIKESKDKKQSFEKPNVTPPFKQEEKIEEKKKKHIGTSSIKETLKQHKVIEKKMALRRQRKINRRYISDEFYFPKSLSICNMYLSSQEEEHSDVPSDFSHVADTSSPEKQSYEFSSKKSNRTLLTLNVKEESKIDLINSPVESLPPTPTQDEQFFPLIPKQDQDSNIPIVEIQTPIPTYLGKLSESTIPVIYTDHSSQITEQRNKKSFKRHNEVSHSSSLISSKSTANNASREDDRQKIKMNLIRRQSFSDSSSHVERLPKSKSRSGQLKAKSLKKLSSHSRPTSQISRNSDTYTSQRYDDSDLYKPRPIIPSSRRSRGSSPPQSSISLSNQSYSPERKKSRYSPPTRSIINSRDSKLQDDDRGRISHNISSQSLNSNQELKRDFSSNDDNFFFPNNLKSGMIPVIYTNQDQQTVADQVDSVGENPHQENIKEHYHEMITLED